jgi:hypothetical protein
LEDHAPAQLARLLLDAGQELGRPKQLEAAGHNAQELAALGDQATRNPIRQIAQLGDRRLHAFARLLCDVGMTVEDARDGLHGYAGLGGHFTDGDTTRRVDFCHCCDIKSRER